MAITVRDIGDAEYFDMTFTDDEGAPADPTAIQVVVREPSGTETTYTHLDTEVTNESVGSWRFTMSSAFDASGWWWIELAGTAGILQAATFRVWVKPRQVDG